MIGSFFLTLVINAFFLSLIFWVLTFFGKWLYSNKYYNEKFNFYECGFKSLTNVKVTYSLNFILLLLFFLIYESEFLFLIPISLNLKLLHLQLFLLLMFFYFWVLFALIVDYIYQGLDWQV